MYDYSYNYDYGYTDYSGTAGLLGGLAVFGIIILVVSIAIGLISIISQWKIYKKAGKKGWECLIPVYNIIVLLQIVELPMWYIALFFVPFANIYAMFKIYIELAHKFGKSTGFGVLTVFFNVICLPILAFGKNNVYVGGNNSVPQVNNNIQTNQYNQPTTFTNNMNNGVNNMNNVANNNSNDAPPFMFDQNINTQINSIPSNQPMNNNINNIGNVTPTPQANLFEAPPITNLQPTMNTVEPIPVIETPAINNVNTQVNEMPQTIEQPQVFTYNPTPTEVSVPEPNVVTPTPVAETQPPVVNPQPVNDTSSVTMSQPVNVIPGMGPTPQPIIPTQNTDNNQNNTTM